MASFKEPTFQERAELAAKAKEAALEAFRKKAPVDESALAERQAAKLARASAEAKRREAKRAAWEQERAARKARANEKRELEAAMPVLTESERKAARDARYAGRKNRRGGA